MKFSDLLALSFENLRRRIGRTVLTVIGVVVGTCAIEVMVSLGIAMDVGFSQMLSEWGDLTTIEIYNWGDTNVAKITDDVVSSFAAIDHVTVATPVYTPQAFPARLISGKSTRYQVSSLYLVGMYPTAIEELDYTLASGNYLPAEATAPGGTGKKKVQVLVGEKTGFAFTDTKKRGEKAMRYDGQTDAAGNPVSPFVDISSDSIILRTGSGNSETEKTSDYTLDILGVLQEDFKHGYATSQGVIMDLTVLKRMEKEYARANNIKLDQKAGYNDVLVKVDEVENVAAVEQSIKDMGYSTSSMSSTRESMQKQAQTIQLVLGGLGAISLFVAALSIANTMTMAIYERTREIGVMKVLGCRLGKIRSMFLMEAAMIGLSGGVIGVVVSYLFSALLNYFGPRLATLSSLLNTGSSVISIIPPWLALLGVGFATLIGVLSGIMPANRAVQISALEAIRHE